MPDRDGQNGTFPVVLTSQQTNSANRVGGPFINTMPTMPQGWTGSGTSYKYISTASGVFGRVRHRRRYRSRFERRQYQPVAV